MHHKHLRGLNGIILQLPEQLTILHSLVTYLPYICIRAPFPNHTHVGNHKQFRNCVLRYCLVNDLIVATSANIDNFVYPAMTPYRSRNRNQFRVPFIGKPFKIQFDVAVSVRMLTRASNIVADKDNLLCLERIFLPLHVRTRSKARTCCFTCGCRHLWLWEGAVGAAPLVLVSNKNVIPVIGFNRAEGWQWPGLGEGRG